MKKHGNKPAGPTKDKKAPEIKDLPPKKDRTDSVKGGMAGGGAKGIPTHASVTSRIKSGPM